MFIVTVSLSDTQCSTCACVGKRVILRVVHNLVQRLRAKRRGSGSVEARLKAVLRKFFANRDYSPSIFVDDSNKT
ncbi:hypothetical protein GQ600_19358 [Phytophthora cactorum]|nr:hypothetical protein GQ600_19358 [Phytophthora cactorum]